MKKVKEKLKNIINRTIFNDIFVMEMVFFIGVFIILLTNFSINIKFGFYSLGFIFIAFSIFLYKFTGKRGDKQ
ncbi:hypothetical protein BCD96_000572 [Clostridium beijerinckii]|nr:hypothetical protein [Clostridium beijerinckii]NRT33247.1 hypothetical protein [Clostridium beijerinckii]NRT47327.1 hypothetical protein [Clostridium beijerinckii]NRU41046.1 hypothetical protein [Clostridium beijerinckii]NRZ18668.1 hypothetical protein [Clostridium beijerinckii]